MGQDKYEDERIFSGAERENGMTFKNFQNLKLSTPNIGAMHSSVIDGDLAIYGKARLVAINISGEINES
jgi:hypothetical protein